MSTTTYRRRGRSNGNYATVEPNDLVEIRRVEGPTVRGFVVETSATGITLDVETAGVWPDFTPSMQRVEMPWKGQRSRVVVSHHHGPDEGYALKSRASYGDRLNRRGRCIDAPCCGCCD